MDELENRPKVAMNCKYFEILNWLYDGFNDLFQTAKSDEDTINILVTKNIMDIKEELTPPPPLYHRFTNDNKMKHSSSPSRYSDNVEYLKLEPSSNSNESFSETLHHGSSTDP